MILRPAIVFYYIENGYYSKRGRSLQEGILQQIITMGGGGFASETTLTLDPYIVAQTGVEHPKVCFLPHAGGENHTTLSPSTRHLRPSVVCRLTCRCSRCIPPRSKPF